MTKEELEQMNAGGESEQQVSSPEQAAEETPPVEDRPNRKAFSDRFKKRHADIDFEDKEARYAAMNDDADTLERYEESGKALSKVFDKHKWLAALAMDMEKNPEDPFYRGNVVIARQQRLKRNFRSKYWEAAIIHIKPLGDVPEDLIPELFSVRIWFVALDLQRHQPQE